MACKLKSGLIQAAYRNTGLKMNKKNVIAVICLFTVITQGLADITTDGTVGPAAQLAGPQFQIGQALGSLSGNNLFHSFGRFNLNSSESATFTGDSHIQNVISRVTGGALSNIDGALKSEIGQAAFYLINPAGIVFGPNAQIDVPGAFYASTAGELKFADGARFSAVQPQGNTLSMAAPVTFGFLGNQTGTMSFNGSDLEFKPGTTVHLSADKITLDNASLKGEGMDLQLSSVGATKEDIGIASLTDHALAGAISINETALDASGNGKGRIMVRAGDVEAVNSQIKANNIGDLNMPVDQGIDMQVGGLSLDQATISSDTSGRGNSGTANIGVQKKMSLINGGLVTSNAFGQGGAGNIYVKTENILLQGNQPKFSGIISEAAPVSANAGNIYISAKKALEVVEYGFVFSSSLGNGNAGNVYVEAEKIRIDGGLHAKNSSISSDVRGGLNNSAGLVKIVATDDLAIVRGGSIYSSTLGKGDAGKVTVEAKRILIDGQGTNLSTGIFSSSQPDSNGHAGTVSVNAQDSLTLLDSGQIASGTFGSGDGGVVEVKARNILIDGKDNDINGTGIFSDSEDFTVFSGNAGVVKVSAQKELKMLNGGQITSSTFGNGGAGKVIVNAETIQIENRIDSKILTGIASRSEQNAMGSPGQLSVAASKSISLKTGDISISSGEFSSKLNIANAKLIISSPQLILSNDSRISAEAPGKLPASSIEINTSQLDMNNSEITTAANIGDGGPITINANDWALLKNSRITTSVGGGIQSLSASNSGSGADIIASGDSLNVLGSNIGNGGDININTDMLVLDSGFIQANTSTTNANGGNINLNVKQLVVSRGILQSGGYIPLIFKPNSGINVIQAAAPDGINGTINNTAPQLNIVGTLVGLNTPQVDLNRVGHDPCSSTVQQSTMKKLGKGGIPSFNKGQDNYTIDRLLPKKLDRSSQTSDLSTVLPDSHDCHPKTMHPQPQNMTKQAG
jgi:filamentous hemagglutinin family protein